MLPERRQAQSTRLETSVPCRLRAEDMTEAFVYIDYYVAKDFSPEKFEESIVNHLNRTRQKLFTFKQIDEKMKNFWGYNANRLSTDPTDHSIIYRKGTKVLKFVDHTLKAIIRARVQKLMAETVSKARDRGRNRNRRKRKAAPIRPDVVGQNRCSKREEMAPFEPSLDFLHTKTDQDCITVEVLPRRPRESNDSQSREFYGDLSAFSDSHIPETLGSPTISSISDFAEDGQSLHTCCSFSKPENHLAIIERPEDRESLLQMLSDREKDLEYVRRELSEAQQAIQIIEDKMQGDASKWAILRKHSGELSEQTLERYLNEIGILKSQLADKRFLRPFTTRMEKNHIPTDIGYFQTNMDVIRGVIADFMSCAEMPHKCNIKLDEKIPDDLSLLFQRVVGESHSVLEFISFHSLLRSLLSAAVCEWVFECDVQENLFATCPLRETMLAHLATQDGVDVVRNLDYAAHHTLIMSKYFQDELLPRRAEALVERAYSTVTPIFGLQKSSSLWKGNILEEWIRTRPALKDMFVSALKIKLRALVTKDTFEVAFPLEGDKFDPQSMEEENLGGESCDSLSGRTPLVRLCLVPGLRKHASNRKLVDYNSFQKPGPCADGQFDPIAKPLVDVYR